MDDIQPGVGETLLDKIEGNGQQETDNEEVVDGVVDRGRTEHLVGRDDTPDDWRPSRRFRPEGRRRFCSPPCKDPSGISTASCP